jgi:hypothetical protein
MIKGIGIMTRSLKEGHREKLTGLHRIEPLFNTNNQTIVPADSSRVGLAARPIGKIFRSQA